MSLLQGSLAALKTGQQTFANQYDKNRQRESLKIAREQQDNANADASRIARKDQARSLVGNINAAIGMGNEWNKTDGLALLEQRPDIAISMFNGADSEEYRKFTNEKGETVGATVVSVRKNEDGSYTPMVERFDTKAIVPMTTGRSAENTDVVKLSPEDVQSTLNARYQAAITDGGLENTSSFLAAGSSIQAVKAKEAALEKGIEKIQNQDERALFYQQVNSIDIEEEGALDALLDIYKSVGGDPEALKAESQQRADDLFYEKVEAEGGYPDGSLAQRLFENGVTREKWNALSPEEQQKVADELGDGQTIENIWDKTVGKSAAGATDIVMSPFEAGSAIWDDFKNSMVGRKLGLSELTDIPESDTDYSSTAPMIRTKARDANAQAVKASSSPITVNRVDAMFNGTPSNTGPGRVPKGTNVQGAAPTPADPVISPPPFELTANNVREAIMSKTSDPTDEQKAQIKNLLKAKGIDTDAQLEEAIKAKELNREQGLMLGWVLGATAEGDTNVKAGIAQGIANLIDRGDQEVGVLQQEQINSARSQAATAAATYQLEFAKFDGTQAEAIAQEGAAALLKMQQDLGLMDENGDPTAKDFKASDDEALKIARRIPGFIARLKRAKGPQEAQAGMLALNGMLGLYLQSKAASDPNGTLSGENWKDIFRQEPNGTVDFDTNNVRVAERNRAGKITKVAYVRDGVLSQAVTVSDLTGDEANVASLLITAAEQNSKNRKATSD